MNIELKNIGLIKDANILLNGLTILIGYNDTGKSTISKTIFSIVKSIINAKKYYYKYKSNILSDYLRGSYLELRKNISKTRIDERSFNEMRRYIDLRELEATSLETLKLLIENEYDEKYLNERKNFYNAALKNYIAKAEIRLNDFDNQYKELFNKEIKNIILKDLRTRFNRIEEIIFFCGRF